MPAGFSRRLVAAGIVVATLVASWVAFGASKATQAASDGTVVHCRVMEAAASAQFHVRLAIFHYRDPADRARLGALLRKYDGDPVQFQSGNGNWQTATVLRLKTCFGRGLIVFSASALPLAAKQDIVVRFPAKAGK